MITIMTDVRKECTELHRLEMRNLRETQNKPLHPPQHLLGERGI